VGAVDVKVYPETLSGYTFTSTAPTYYSIHPVNIIVTNTYRL